MHLIYIFQKSNAVEKAPQPTSSLKLLNRCINRTEKTQKSTTEKKIIEISNEILSLRAQASASRGRKKCVNVKIVELEKQVKEPKRYWAKKKINYLSCLNLRNY